MRLLVRACWLVVGSLMVCVSAQPRAHASGPVERLLQVMANPGEPDRLVLRFGAAAEGFLFSSDGGHTFRASCSQGIDPALTRISRTTSLYDAPALLDAEGKLLVSTVDALWEDDGSGCTWTKQSAFDGMRVASLQRAPSGNELLALVITSSGSGESREARTELFRRGAGGAWASGGLLKAHVAKQRAFGGELIAIANGSGTRLYATLTVSVGTAPQDSLVVVSDDGGLSWREGDILPAAQATLKLVAADPEQPDRLLGVLTSDEQADKLLLSDDQGKTFRAYSDVEQLSGVSFAPDGRIFVGDAGSGAGAAMGGVWSAAKLGDPLTLLPAPEGVGPGVDCVGYDARANKLQVCKIDRFGLLDPASGAFEEQVRFEAVAELISCPGRDMLAICQPQFNAGASWCCDGHFPFSPFCGEYNVTSANGRPVACGLAGREAERARGGGPTLDAGTQGPGAPEAGVPDAGAAGDASTARPVDAGAAPDAGAKRRADDGCQLSAGEESRAPGWLLLATGALAWLSRRSRRSPPAGGRSR